MGGPVLNKALAGDGSLHIVAELGEHRQTAAPDLLHLQRGSHIRVVGQTQRVKSLATRAHQIKVSSTEWITDPTASLDGTHQDKLAGQHGKDGLAAHQHGGTHVVQATKLEDHSSSLEAHTLTGTIVDSSVLLQQLRGQAPEYAQRHTLPCPTLHPCTWPCGVLPPGILSPPLRPSPAPSVCARTVRAMCVAKPVPSPLPLPLRARCLGTCVAVALTFSCLLVALLLPPLVVLAHYAKHYA